MTTSWRRSPAWLLAALLVSVFAVGVVLPLELASYRSVEDVPHLDESLQTSFRVAYLGQWSGFGNHWYNYSVTFAAQGLNWSDLWMTVYFNGTTTELPTDAARTVINNAAVASFSFLTGNWKGGSAVVQAGQTMSVDTAEFEGDGNILYIAAINGYFTGSLTLVIP